MLIVVTVQKPMLKLEAVSRVAAIPIVESGIDVTEKIYHKIKVRFKVLTELGKTSLLILWSIDLCTYFIQYYKYHLASYWNSE